MMILRQIPEKRLSKLPLKQTISMVGIPKYPLKWRINDTEN